VADDIVEMFGRVRGGGSSETTQPAVAGTMR
jgi:hypothetical protein